MRIGAISDLHIDRHPKLKSNVYLETLIKVVQHREIDLLLIAGDISNYFRDSYQFIKDLKLLYIFPYYLFQEIMIIGKQRMERHLKIFMIFIEQSQSVCWIVHM